MEHNARDNFHLIWMIAIIVCAFLGAFSAIFASCSRVSDDGAAQAAVLPAATPTPYAAGTVTDTAASGEPAAGQDSAPADTAQPSETPEAEEATPEPTPTPIPEGVVLESTIDMGQSYVDRFVVLGDSTSYGLAAYNVLPNAQVWVTADASLPLYSQSYANINYYTAGGSMQQMSIDAAIAQRQPEFLLISLGIDSVASMTEEDFKQEYTDLITRIQAASPNTRIICQSIFPVINDQVTGALKNDRLNTADGWIIGVAAETGVKYLDSREALADDDGNLKEEYTNGDGIHLNEEAFRQVIQYIRTHGYLT